MKRFLRILAIALVVVVGSAVFYPVTRVVFYGQSDDDERVELKREYLAELARSAERESARPNLVVILFDDLGYGDIGAYGSRSIRTPHIDRLAEQGVLFRQAYSASPYCSASRAGLLTGRYPIRAGMDHVIQPAGGWKDWAVRLAGWNRRLPAEEITLADVLSEAGYATAIFGKWHLGSASPSLPTEMGFDTFYGLHYSNDQGEPEVFRNRKVVEEHPIDQTTLTRRYTEQAVRFIESHHDRPFFLYVPHTFPHIPLHAAADRRGRSPAGLYGDVVEELDESVGAVIEALERTGVADNTLVLVTSDNGPWFQGSPGGKRGRKMDIFEGGMRVPFIASWPGRVPGGRIVDDVVMGIDLFPTMLELIGLPAPQDRIIDGRSLVALLEGRPAPSRGPIYYHQMYVLRAVRQGRFKYHDRHGVFFGNPGGLRWAPMKPRGPWLFDLEQDPGESYDATDRYPQTAVELRALLEAHDQALTDNPRGWH